MKIGFACDHGGLELKNSLMAHAKEKGFEVTDYGTFTKDSCDYPDFAYLCAKSVADGVNERGVVVCTTGIGVSMVANKVKGVRCALCHSIRDAEMTRRHNNANMIAMGQSSTDEGLADEMLDVFLSTEFEGGRHERRVNKITAIETL